MRRRDFIKVVAGSAVVAWPVAGRAQQPVMPVVGFLHIASADAFPHLIAAFHQGLKETGYVENQNVAIEYRWAEGHYERLPALAADLVRRRVSVIVTGGGEPSALAAKAATTTIPIVFNVGRDPVDLGLVASLGQPGGNATGVNIFTQELGAKRLGLLHELAPPGSLISYLLNSDSKVAEIDAKNVAEAAERLGRKMVFLRAKNDTEISAAFAAMAQQRPGALFVGADPFFNSRRSQIVALAAQLGVPAIYEQREFAVAGGLFSYGTSLSQTYHQEGIYAGRILKGQKPADLPVLQLTKFELVINLKTAKALGLTIPSGVMAIADEVIE